MRKLITLSFVLLLFGLNLSAGNQNFLNVLERKSYVFSNRKCAENNSCSLKRIQYLVEDYTILLVQNGENFSPERYNYGTRMYASYETESLETLEDYVFVQFIKGCVYRSYLEKGRVVRIQDVSKPFLDDYIPFKFKKWTIDSGDNDPVYSTLPGFSRHAGLRWNNTDYFNDKDEMFYKDGKPLTPVLYTTDRPGSAFYSKGMANNVSLVLKMCIYKTKDVPVNTDLDNTSFAEPIHCYEWSNSFIFNHVKMRFEQPKGIATTCR